MKTENTTHVWIALGSDGRPLLWTASSRRVDAKLARVEDFSGKKEVSPDGKGMTTPQMKIWDERVKAGEKVVKATLTW